MKVEELGMEIYYKATTSANFPVTIVNAEWLFYRGFHSLNLQFTSVLIHKCSAGVVFQKCIQD